MDTTNETALDDALRTYRLGMTDDWATLREDALEFAENSFVHDELRCEGGHIVFAIDRWFLWEVEGQAWFDIISNAAGESYRAGEHVADWDRVSTEVSLYFEKTDMAGEADKFLEAMARVTSRKPWRHQAATTINAALRHLGLFESVENAGMLYRPQVTARLWVENMENLLEGTQEMLDALWSAPEPERAILGTVGQSAPENGEAS